jgi:toxin ParE1/3/4
MASVHFSNLAEADLLEIGTYTQEKWGKVQAIEYLSGIEICCRHLEENPSLGRSCEYIRPGLKRMEHGRHVIFYRIASGGVLVSRILHQSMLPVRHIMDETL